MLSAGAAAAAASAAADAAADAGHYYAAWLRCHAAAMLLLLKALFSLPLLISVPAGAPDVVLIRLACLLPRCCRRRHAPPAAAAAFDDALPLMPLLIATLFARPLVATRYAAAAIIAFTLFFQPLQPAD